MNVLTAGYKIYNNQENGYTNHRLKDLVKDLKQQMSNPKLSASERKEIACRIAKIETASITEQKSLDVRALGINVAEFAAGFAGPVGSGIASTVTYSAKKSIESKRNSRIKKAKRVGGRRIARKKHKSKSRKKPESRTYIDTASVVDGLYAAGSDVASEAGSSLFYRTINYLGSFFF